MKFRPVIIIPVHKTNLDDDEALSLNHVITILGHFPIYFVKPRTLRLNNYPNNNLKCINFDDQYFKSIDGYNKLLTSLKLFRAFKQFTHMLIYQLDSLVFKDELLMWSKKNYDYIGSPWFKGYLPTENSKEIVGVGNGGFSLRSIKKSISILQRLRLARLFDKIKRKLISVGFLKAQRKLSYIESVYFRLLKIKSDSCFINKLINQETFNEDGFWSIWVANTFRDYIVAPIDEATRFGFEVNPSTLYFLNNSTLPFGCHAWRKYEYETFWINHIKIQ